MVGSDPVQHPELHKKPGVHYAFTDDGLELPLIDVTHQAFAITRPDEVQREAVEKFMREQRDFAKLPKFVQRAMMWMFFRKSRLGNSLRTSDGTFLPGVATYLLKLPPEMLGEAYARPVDRAAAGERPGTPGAHRRSRRGGPRERSWRRRRNSTCGGNRAHRYCIEINAIWPIAGMQLLGIRLEIQLQVEEVHQVFECNDPE